MFIHVLSFSVTLPNWSLTLAFLHSHRIVQVSLDSRVREIINKNMMNPSKDTFAEAQLQIYTLMHRDSYPRFVNSTNYKQLLESAPDTS